MEAAERPLQGLGSHLDAVEARLAAPKDLRDNPPGTIRSPSPAITPLPSRRQPTPAFAVLVEALRYRGRS